MHKQGMINIAIVIKFVKYFFAILSTKLWQLYQWLDWEIGWLYWIAFFLPALNCNCIYINASIHWIDVGQFSFHY